MLFDLNCMEHAVYNTRCLISTSWSTLHTMHVYSYLNCMEYAVFHDGVKSGREWTLQFGLVF